MSWRSDNVSGDDDQRSWYDGAADGADAWRAFDDPRALSPLSPDDSAGALSALDAFDDGWDKLAGEDDSDETLIVPGNGVSMGAPFIQRRERPLALRLGMLMLMACILVTGIFAITPLGSSPGSNGTAFQALAGSMVWSQRPGYFLYTAMPGDTIDSVARRFHVQVGGIFEMNNLYVGAEFGVGILYKIPTDPNYGKDYRPIDIMSAGATNYGNKRFGPNWWNSIAGQEIPSDSPCAPDGGSNPMGFQLTSPNWDSAWVRGFIVYGTWIYHTGVDLAAAEGNPIHAAQQGQVIWAGYDATNGLGWSVKIDHCNHVSTVYGHMAKLLVSVGQYVTQGEPIGLEGSTGDSKGPHLHFMVEWNNLWVDPMPFYASKYTISHYAVP